LRSLLASLNLKPLKLIQALGNPLNLFQTHQKHFDKLVDSFVYDSLSNSFKTDNILKIKTVCKHSLQKYWDIHIEETNCYFANGILHHNSGKSHERAESLIDEHCTNPNQNTVCIREVQKTLEHSVKSLLEQKIKKFNVGEYFDVQRGQINSNYGDGKIIFQGMQDHTAESIKSLEDFDRSWVEEAQSLSQRSLDLLRPTIRKPNSEHWFTWNPRFNTDPIDVFLRGETPFPQSVVIQVNFNDNPWLPQVLKDEMEYDRSRDIDKYEHVWLGGYVKNSNTRVFRNWAIQEFDTPPDVVHRLGADWGFSVDPTTLVRCHIIGRKLYIDYEAYMVGCDIVDTPNLFLTVPEAEKWPIVADSSRPETVSYMRQNGFPKIMGAVKGTGSIEDGIEFLKGYDIIVHPRCKHVADELLHYSYKTDPLTGKVLPILADKNNHTIDALRYACEAVRRIKDKKEIKYVEYRQR
jgi:phage terminase large subunit